MAWKRGGRARSRGRDDRGRETTAGETRLWLANDATSVSRRRAARERSDALRRSRDAGARREHVRVEDDLLRVVALVRDDGRAADLAARAARRRHGDAGHHARRVDAVAPVLAVLEVEEGPVLADHERDALGRVHGRAAAEGDDAVAAVGLEGRDAAGDVRLRRVALDVRIDGAAAARRGRVRDHRPDARDACADDAAARASCRALLTGVRDEEGLRDAELLAAGLQLADAARAEAHGLRRATMTDRASRRFRTPAARRGIIPVHRRQGALALDVASHARQHSARVRHRHLEKSRGGSQVGRKKNDN